MSDKLAQEKEHDIIAADIVNQQLVLKRYDGTLVKYGEAVYDPHINSLQPESGGPGEQTILITGEHFNEDAVVEANQMEASMTYFMEETQLYAQFTEASVGEVEITVRQGEQESNSVMFNVVAPPTLTNLSPNNGPAPALLTITGTGFASIAKVIVDQMTEYPTVYVSETTLTCSSFGELPPGTFQICVDNSGGMAGILSNELPLTII
jgi:hypothetical protein